MTSDERNFRSIYYEKVGCKSVEEKKSLENLLKENNPDLTKLKQFSLRFAVPHVYRSLLWKLLLGVIPMQAECRSFVISQRKQEYNDLKHSLTVLNDSKLSSNLPVVRLADEKTPMSQRFFLMWLIQSGNLTFDSNLCFTKHSSFLPIVKCLMHFFDDEVDIYWIAKTMYENIDKVRNEVPTLIKVSHKLLEREDSQLYKFLVANSMMNYLELPLTNWFNCCFAGVIPENCLIKIWDKICGGTFKILAYLTTVILITLKPRITKMNDPAKLVDCIKSLPEETADIILNKTNELWQQHLNSLNQERAFKPPSFETV